MLTQGAIGPSKSPYSSPMLIIPKKIDDTGKKKFRIVIDYRLLNEKTIGDACPLSNITDILDQLGNTQYFTVFDLESGFHRIELDPADRPDSLYVRQRAL